MRSKENAQDYRYFPDPDLIPVALTEEWVEEMRAAMPELPQAKRERYVNELKLSPDTAKVLTSDKNFASLFDDAYAVCGKARETANTITTDIIALVKEAGIEPSAMKDGSGKISGYHHFGSRRESKPQRR